jgi:hypothetical protein
VIPHVLNKAFYCRPRGLVNRKVKGRHFRSGDTMDAHHHHHHHHSRALVAHCYIKPLPAARVQKYHGDEISSRAKLSINSDVKFHTLSNKQRVTSKRFVNVLATVAHVSQILHSSALAFPAPFHPTRATSTSRMTIF